MVPQKKSIFFLLIRKNFVSQKISQKSVKTQKEMFFLENKKPSKPCGSKGFDWCAIRDSNPGHPD